MLTRTPFKQCQPTSRTFAPTASVATSRPRLHHVTAVAYSALPTASSPSTSTSYGPAPRHWPSGARPSRHHVQPRHVAAWCAAPDKQLPADVQLEIKGPDEGSEIEYDSTRKVARIPLSAVGDAARRSKMVIFTCNKCEGRTARMVNPVAWEKGTVFGQCGQCKAWHVLSANNKAMYEEINYKTDPEYANIDVDALRAKLGMPPQQPVQQEVQ